MAFLDELLGRDEQLLYIARQHPFTLIGNILAELFLVAVLIAAGVISQRAFTNSGSQLFGLPIAGLVLLVCIVISLIVLASALYDYLRWTNRQYVITDQRVLQVEGVLSKHSTDSSLEKINDLELRQSLLGRIFNYGDLEVLTGSEIGINNMQKISHPLEFKRVLLEAKHNLSRGFGYLDPQAVAAYAQPGRPEDRLNSEDLQKRLLTLADLRDRGLISSEEFEDKKRELLSRM